MKTKRLLAVTAIAVVSTLLAACGSSGTSSKSSGSGPIKIGVDLTYNNTAFWSAYVNYEQQYAQQMNVKLIGPLLSAASASVQNQQIEVVRINALYDTELARLKKLWAGASPGSLGPVPTAAPAPAAATAVARRPASAPK